MSFEQYKIFYKDHEKTVDEINQIKNIKLDPKGSYYDEVKECFITEYIYFDESDYLRIRNLELAANLKN